MGDGGVRVLCLVGQCARVIYVYCFHVLASTCVEYVCSRHVCIMCVYIMCIYQVVYGLQGQLQLDGEPVPTSQGVFWFVATVPEAMYSKVLVFESHGDVMHVCTLEHVCLNHTVLCCTCVYMWLTMIMVYVFINSQGKRTPSVENTMCSLLFPLGTLPCVMFSVVPTT